MDHVDDAPLRRLLAALPERVQRGVAWLREKRRIWLRAPVAVLLLCGGVFAFLPVLGLWMLPLGILLLADDLPFLRRPSMAALGTVQAWWDRARARWGHRR